jgi:hypothetical protein
MVDVIVSSSALEVILDSANRFQIVERIVSRPGKLEGVRLVRTVGERRSELIAWQGGVEPLYHGTHGWRSDLVKADGGHSWRTNELAVDSALGAPRTIKK